MKTLILFSIVFFCCLPSNAQVNKPSPKEVIKNKITKVTLYSFCNWFGDIYDTTILTYDKHGYQVSADEGRLGIFVNEYSYNDKGQPVYCLEYNGNQYKMDSIAYVYNPDGSYATYKYDYEDFSYGSLGKNWNRDEDYYDAPGRKIKNVSVDDITNYFYDKEGNKNRETVTDTNSAVKEKIFTLQYDTNGKMIKRSSYSEDLPEHLLEEYFKYDAYGRLIEKTWSSDLPDTPCKETYTYNSIGLISEYTQNQYGESVHYIRTEKYIYH